MPVELREVERGAFPRKSRGFSLPTAMPSMTWPNGHCKGCWKSMPKEGTQWGHVHLSGHPAEERKNGTKRNCRW